MLNRNEDTSKIQLNANMDELRKIWRSEKLEINLYIKFLQEQRPYKSFADSSDEW